MICEVFCLNMQSSNVALTGPRLTEGEQLETKSRACFVDAPSKYTPFARKLSTVRLKPGAVVIPSNLMFSQTTSLA